MFEHVSFETEHWACMHKFQPSMGSPPWLRYNCNGTRISQDLLVYWFQLFHYSVEGMQCLAKLQLMLHFSVRIYNLRLDQVSSQAGPA